MHFTYANVLHKPPVNRFLFPLCHDLRALWPCWFSYNYLDPLWLAQIRRISRPKLRADFHPFLSVPNLAKYQKNVNLPHAHVQGFRIKKKKKKRQSGLMDCQQQTVSDCAAVLMLALSAVSYPNFPRRPFASPDTSGAGEVKSRLVWPGHRCI